jgi:hypothetical protein
MILESKKRNEAVLLERLRIKSEKKKRLIEARLQTQQANEYEKKRKE